MKSASWASYQSALPPEARAGGEPDDDYRSPVVPEPLKPIVVRVDPFEPPTIKDGFTPIQVVARAMATRGIQHTREKSWWLEGTRHYPGLGPKTLEEALVQAFEHVLYRIGLDNCEIIVTCMDVGGIESAAIFDGEEENWVWVDNP